MYLRQKDEDKEYMKCRPAMRKHNELKVAASKNLFGIAVCQQCDHCNAERYCKILKHTVGRNTYCRFFEQQLQIPFTK